MFAAGEHLSHAMDRWVTGRLDRGEVKPETARVSRRAVSELIEAVGDIPARKLDKRHAEAWMSHTTHLAATTRRHRHGIVHQFCEWLIDEEIIDRNPFRHVTPPKPGRRPPRSMPHQAISELLRACPTSRDRLIVTLMAQQGLRCIGVANLRAEDIDLVGRTMRVTEKFGNERVLPITDECFEALTEYLYEHPVSRGPVIRKWIRTVDGLVADDHDGGMKPATISRYVSELMDKAGVKLAPGDGRSAHALRHTCATDMLADGADLMVVRDVLGHTSLATTQMYLSVQPDRLAGAMGGRRYGR